MNSSQIQNISVHDLKKKLDADPKLCLIDVRELKEWQALRIPHAIHIPKDTLPDRITEVVTNKEQPIYLHCQGGVRSLTAAETLQNLGYTNLFSIDGGISEWAIFGYPVEK